MKVASATAIVASTSWPPFSGGGGAGGAAAGAEVDWLKRFSGSVCRGHAAGELYFVPARCVGPQVR
jgi:hypothetical protein